MTRTTLEVCVEDAHGIAAAVGGGADRIELCAALDVGGLTPPASLVRAAAQAPLPVHLLARPRAGGFVYDAADRALVAEDIRTAAEAGLAGVVIGASREDGRLDTDLLARWIAFSRDLGEARGTPLSLTLHRAFDLVPDLPTALDEAVALGFERILTSGGAPLAVDGGDMLATLVARAGDRITILAGSGVSATTLPAILSTGVREVHASCRAPLPAADPMLARFGFAAVGAKATDAATVTELVHFLRADRS
ncbi:copper homeostasis protein CutC [Sphingomonas endophytica]|uniref:PF03932 family protein CutC n=1 Tax=Sphingomonas endophytica TaxID=869719 RepID=A0A147HXT3_9SPHN|nr:copper homeostasis protein CutC [Sphingomonas endophytica]KTT69748.1 copper homeostasis protein CutC [Sphingomonas endophytica]